jgi:spermidine synthase
VPDETWIAEALYPAWGQRFRIRRELAHERSAFQDIRIVETESHGRAMLLDGVVQITEADEFAYQEMIAHVPLTAHGAARRVLIIGAGDGGVLRRVLGHRGVASATMVEIDAAVVRLCRAHLPGIGGAAWDDPRARVLIADGIAHVREAEAGAYDVIIVDSTDPVGVGAVLFTDAFYADCARILGPRGILVNQCGVPFMQGEELRDTSARRARHFADVSAYLAAVPTYVGGFMTLGWSAQDASLRQIAADEITRRAAEAGILGTTRYWSPGVHQAAFALPPYIAALLPRN